MKTISQIKLEDIMSVYSGLKGCMCGCKGKYSYAHQHREEASAKRGYTVNDEDVSIRNVKRILNLFKKNADMLTYDDECRIVCLDSPTRTYIMQLSEKSNPLFDM